MSLRDNGTGISMTFKAAADLSSYQHHCMKLSAADTVNVAGAGESVIGILQNKPDAAGKPAHVIIAGPSMLVVDGSGTAITRQCALKSDASGHGVINTTDNAECIGRAFEASSASGDKILVNVAPDRY